MNTNELTGTNSPAAQHTGASTGENTQRHRRAEVRRAANTCVELLRLPLTLAGAFIRPARCACAQGTACVHRPGRGQEQHQNWDRGRGWPAPERRVPRQARRHLGNLALDLLERDYPHWRIMALPHQGGGGLWIVAAHGSYLVREDSVQAAREHIHRIETTPSVWPARPYLEHLHRHSRHEHPDPEDGDGSGSGGGGSEGEHHAARARVRRHRLAGLPTRHGRTR